MKKSDGLDSLQYIYRKTRRVCVRNYNGVVLQVLINVCGTREPLYSGGSSNFKSGGRGSILAIL